MTKEDIIESYATTLKSWVGLALSKEECVSLISDVTNEALSLGTVGCSKKISDIVLSALYNQDEFNIRRYPDDSIASLDEDKIIDFVKKRC
jgi:hypothetical protein